MILCLLMNHLWRASIGHIAQIPGSGNIEHRRLYISRWHYAKNLKGHLMLTHGTMDDNVPLNNTLLVADALIKANKDFDLLLIPNAHHGYGEAGPYVMRRRWDYFVKNLAGGTPPVDYQMKSYAEIIKALYGPAASIE